MDRILSSTLKKDFKFLSFVRKSSTTTCLSEIGDSNESSVVDSYSSSNEDLKHTNAVTHLRSISSCPDYPDNIITDLSGNFSDSVSIDKEKDLVDCTDEIKCEGEVRYSDEFRDKETHYFILSQSGKPIFSRYGSDSQIAAFIGVMQAMISFVESGDDNLKVMTAGSHNFLFLVKENIILVAVSSGAYAPNQLKIILNQVYYQIISLLTFRTISTAFHKQPSLDLRRLLVGTDCYIHGIIDYMERDLASLLSSIVCVTMPEGLRASMLNTIVQYIKCNDVVFAILLLDDQLVGVVRRKDYQYNIMDIHLVLNLIRNSEYFKTQVCWLPICLPKFDPDGYFYAHIAFIVNRLSLVLLTVNPDQFNVLQSAHNQIILSITSNGLAEKIHSMNTIDKIVHSYKLIELKHFVYKLRRLNQCISFSSTKTTNDDNLKRIINQYLRLHRLIHRPDRPGRLVYQCTDTNTIFAWQTGNFELYATLDRIGNKGRVMEVVNKLLFAIDKNQKSLFIQINPTF